MGLPQIQFTLSDLVTLEFQEDLSDLQITYPRTVRTAVAGSGPEERLGVRQDCIVTATWDMVVKTQGVGAGGTDRDMKRKLKSFFSLAQRNRVPWTFARDSADTVMTELLTGVGMGDTSVDVEDPSGIVVGRNYVIRNDVDIDVVKVQSISGQRLTLEEPLFFDFYECDRFRSEEFWPGIYVMTSGESGASSPEDPIVEIPPLHFGVKWTFRESYP